MIKSRTPRQDWGSMKMVQARGNLTRQQASAALASIQERIGYCKTTPFLLLSAIIIRTRIASGNVKLHFPLLSYVTWVLLKVKVPVLNTRHFQGMGYVSNIFR